MCENMFYRDKDPVIESLKDPFQRKNWKEVKSYITEVLINSGWFIPDSWLANIALPFCFVCLHIGLILITGLLRIPDVSPTCFYCP